MFMLNNQIVIDIAVKQWGYKEGIFSVINHQD
jgi:hypothetical protein